MAAAKCSRALTNLQGKHVGRDSLVTSEKREEGEVNVVAFRGTRMEQLPVVYLHIKGTVV